MSVLLSLSGVHAGVWRQLSGFPRWRRLPGIRPGGHLLAVTAGITQWLVG